MDRIGLDEARNGEAAYPVLLDYHAAEEGGL
jgi:hypothetical protein